LAVGQELVGGQVYVYLDRQVAVDKRVAVDIRVVVAVDKRVLV
jgi:hypothetical protein